MSPVSHMVGSCGVNQGLCLCWLRTLGSFRSDSRNCSTYGLNLSTFLSLSHVMFCFIFFARSDKPETKRSEFYCRLFLAYIYIYIWIYLIRRFCVYYRWVFYELCRIFTSPPGELKYKQLVKTLGDTTNQNVW